MPGIGSLYVANSGLRVAQAGLYVTGHSMSNSTTPGYTRQRMMQHEFMQNNIGYNGSGLLQVGLGVDVSEIRQLRDTFVDLSYRDEVSRRDFYQVKSETGLEIEAIIGELQGAYNSQTVIDDVWRALNELSTYQPGLETRSNFISTCVSFVNKANNVSERLIKYQSNLDLQIRDNVTKVNQLLERIKKYNELISDVEVVGEHANDYRDTRNLALDELSSILNISYKEKPDASVDIFCEGNALLVNNNVNYLSLRYTSPGYDSVEPVLTGAKKTNAILGYDAEPSTYRALFDLSGDISPELDNDKGILKGLMVARGYSPVNYALNPSLNPIAAPPALPTGASPATVLEYNKYMTNYNNYLTEFNRFLANPNSQIRPDLPPNATSLITAINNDAAVTSDTAYMASINNFKNQLNTYNKDFNLNFKLFKQQMFDRDYAFIPRVQREFDNLVHSIVTMINNAVSPIVEDPANPGTYIKDTANAPYGLDQSQFDEVFVRKYLPFRDRFNGNVYLQEDPKNIYSLYSIGNIEINPKLLNTDGFNKLALSINRDDVEDTRLVLTNLMDKWKSAFISYENNAPLSVDDSYRQFVNSISTETREAITYHNQQVGLVTQTDNKRQTISGVSLDEELTSMMKFQHAYNASARIFNVIDSMIDTVVNKTGRS